MPQIHVFTKVMWTYCMDKMHKKNPTCFLVDHHKLYFSEPDRRRNSNIQLQKVSRLVNTLTNKLDIH